MVSSDRIKTDVPNVHGDPIPAITLWQPYASLMFAKPLGATDFVKGTETRSTRLPEKHRGRPVVIHAAAKFPPLYMISEELHELCLDVWGCNYNHSLPLGKALGTVVFTDCLLADEYRKSLARREDVTAGDWSNGRWLWPAVEQVEFARPIPAKGKQGWWRFSPPHGATSRPPQTDSLTRDEPHDPTTIDLQEGR